MNKSALPSTKIYLGPLSFGRRTYKFLITIIELKKTLIAVNVYTKNTCLVQVR